jgi:hypothetical protein
MDKKKELLESVESWIKQNEEAAIAAFKESAEPVIQMLEKIEKVICP